MEVSLEMKINWSKVYDAFLILFMLVVLAYMLVAMYYMIFTVMNW